MMTAQGIANSIWAVAKLANTFNSEAWASLLPSLVSKVRVVVPDMIAQHTSNVIWATGQLSVDPSHAAISQSLREVLPLVVTQAGTVLASATAQELANACWGLALCDYTDASFLRSAADKVTNEAAGWKPVGAQLDLPFVLCSFARLHADGHDDMMNAAAEKLAPMLSQVNDWGLCAVFWSYQQLDINDNLLAFRRNLNVEVKRRQLSDQDVVRSRLGPEAW
ncbi:unnamed protein product [Effrenium voratum]|uniref:Uncharacterized protein n=1 Tax=Effrenium voratum TaxID=2562239 RepID=A0AA36J2H9_9DINO|nr:unnamed protein product [Effrenium voratum]CAJ1425588.1 unnamed protein product [Effrenium voratum]